MEVYISQQKKSFKRYPKNTPSLPAFALVFSIAVIVLAACAPQTMSVETPVDATQSFSQTGEQALPERWWTAFQDPSLTVMIDSALTNNFNLLSAWERLQAAKAVWDREAATLIPNINASTQSGISFPQPDFVGGENVRLTLSADYEVDLWGRIRSSIEAQRLRANASLTDYQAAAISLAAEIARNWYQLVEARGQLQLVNDQIETNQNILNLLEARFGGGQIRGVDILRQRQLIESNQAQRVNVETQIQVLEHQLLVLLGRPAMQNVEYDLATLPNPPALPQTGIPIDLVRRRPDIQSAVFQIQAADQEVAAAISNKYPRLSLNASTSLRSNNFEGIFKSWAYSFAGNLVAPVFYGGELQAEVDRTKAVKNQLLYDYGQAVLTAFREVEDALIQEQKQEERIQNIEDQINLAQQTYEQLRFEYLNGLSTYLDVLTALTQEQQLRRDLLTAKRTLLEFRIALYRAIAGKFETERERNKALELN